MRSFLSLFFACALSLCLYFFAFGVLLSRPIVVDEVGLMLSKKLAYAQSIHQKKIVILAGSNARFSHSCATIEKILARPCVNMGINASIELDWEFSHFRQLLHPGDLLYLPLEYEQYRKTSAEEYSGMDAAFAFRHEIASLLPRGPIGIARAAFMFDLPNFVDSLIEMTLWAKGFRPHADVEGLDNEGDQTDNNKKSAAQYWFLVSHMKFVPPDAKNLIGSGGGPDVAHILDWCRANHVIVVGGLPTVFNDARISNGVVEQLRRFYAAHSAYFLELPNRSQYPRSDFFDTSYHLRYSAQIVHSRLVAAGLQPYLTPNKPAETKHQ